MHRCVQGCVGVCNVCRECRIVQECEGVEWWVLIC